MKEQMYLSQIGITDFTDAVNKAMKEGWMMLVGTEQRDYHLYDRAGLFTCVLEREIKPTTKGTV